MVMKDGRFMLASLPLSIECLRKFDGNVFMTSLASLTIRFYKYKERLDPNIHRIEEIEREIE
jgi:hypothetical protein